MNKKFDLLGVAGIGKKKSPRVDPKYATLNRRMIAATIDCVIIMVLIAPVTDYMLNWFYHTQSFDYSAIRVKVAAAPTPEEKNQIFMHEMAATGEMTRWMVNSIIQTLILCAATSLCWLKWSATPGKILLRMRIADAVTEAPITERQIVLRLFGYVVSTIFLCGGFFWIGIDKRRQGWHDKIAHTVVLYIPKEKVVVSDQAL